VNHSVEVDKYLENIPEESKKALQELRENVFEFLPEAEEYIYYHMPTFRYKGKPFLVYASFKNHCSLITMRQSVIENLKEELKGYAVAGTTIHFTTANPISKETLKKIVEERILGVPKSLSSSSNSNK